VTEDERWQLEELITRYTLEPSIRDLFVEGRSDCMLFGWFLASRGATHVDLFEIETVDIPAADVLGLGLPDNKRGRVLALGHALETALGPNAGGPRLVVDSDFEVLFQREGRPAPQTKRSLVLRTDYASLEMYLYREDAIAKALRVACHVRDVDAAGLLRAIEGPLRWLFCFRAAIETMQLCVGVHFDGELDGKTMDLNRDSFLVNSLSRHKQARRAKEVAQEIEKHRAAATADRRHFIHGHDFVQVLAWFLRKHARAFKSARPESVEAALWNGWENCYADGHPLFVALMTWANGPCGTLAGS
jgi:hypothetical protein